MAKALTLKTVFQAIDKMSGPTKTITSKVERFGKVASRAAKIGAGVAKATAAMAGTALIAGAAVGRAALAFSQRGDDIARNAAILGLSAQAYQELSYAANLADVEQEAFASATKKLNNNLGQLRAGTGALATILNATNPALARQLKTAKSTDDAFNLVASAIAKETNAQKRAALAQAAFGRTGQELIPMMETLAAARQEARDSGSIISDEDVKSASRLDDALKRIKAVASGPINSALAMVAEKVSPIIERITAWIGANRELIGQRLDEALSAIARVGSGVFKVFSALAPALKPLWDLVMSLAPALEAVGRIIAAILKPFVALISTIADGLSSMLGNKEARARFQAATRDTSFQGAAYEAYGNPDGQDAQGYTPSPAERAGLSRAGINNAEGVNYGPYGAMAPATRAPISPAPAPVSSSSSRYEEYRQTVGFDFSGMPPGVSARVSGKAPPLSLNRGPTMGALAGAAH